MFFDFTCPGSAPRGMHALPLLPTTQVHLGGWAAVFACSTAATTSARGSEPPRPVLQPQLGHQLVGSLDEGEEVAVQPVQVDVEKAPILEQLQAQAYGDRPTLTLD